MFVWIGGFREQRRGKLDVRNLHRTTEGRRIINSPSVHGTGPGTSRDSELQTQVSLGLRTGRYLTAKEPDLWPAFAPVMTS